MDHPELPQESLLKLDYTNQIFDLNIDQSAREEISRNIFQIEQNSPFTEGEANNFIKNLDICGDRGDWVIKDDISNSILSILNLLIDHSTKLDLKLLEKNLISIINIKTNKEGWINVLYKLKDKYGYSCSKEAAIKLVKIADGKNSNNNINIFCIEYIRNHNMIFAFLEFTKDVYINKEYSEDIRAAMLHKLSSLVLNTSDEKKIQCLVYVIILMKTLRTIYLDQQLWIWRYVEQCG